MIEGDVLDFNQSQDVQNQVQDQTQDVQDIQDTQVQEPLQDTEPQDVAQDTTAQDMQTQDVQDIQEPEPAQPEPTQPQPEPQQPAQPAPLPLELKKQIIQEATKTAQEVFKQVYGKEYDDFEATPEEKIFFQELVNEAKKQIEEAYVTQQRQQVFIRNYQVVQQQILQRIKPEEARAIMEYFENLPVKQAQQIELNLAKAIEAGDLQTAIQIIDDLRAKALQKSQSQPQSKPEVKVPYSEPPSVSGEPEAPPDESEEVWSFFS